MRLGAEAVTLPIGRDDRDSLRRLVEQGLAANVLVLCGGVSAGKLDLVPGQLQACDVRQVFHKVSLKPGKPLWFGRREDQGKNTLVFGLPGNPVSTLVAFELFVKPALLSLSGKDFQAVNPQRGILTSPITHQGQRTTYYPCQINFGNREGVQDVRQP